MPIDVEQILAGLPAYGPPTQAQDELTGYGMSSAVDPSGAWRTGAGGKPVSAPERQLIAYPRANINPDELSIMERQPEFANQLRARLERLNAESPGIAGAAGVNRVGANLDALNNREESAANEIARSALLPQAPAPVQQDKTIIDKILDSIRRYMNITDSGGKNKLDAAFEASGE